jgi:hypothetical protein
VLAYRKGVDLMVVRGKWYLAIVCNVPDPEKVVIQDVLGISASPTIEPRNTSRAYPHLDRQSQS